jgi:murein tripeptide amidase MpaA
VRIRLLTLLLALALHLGGAVPASAAPGMPAGFELYHTYAEMVAKLDAAVADHPSLVHKFSIGRSYEGRKIWAVKVSDNVRVDEDEPEVVFDSLAHARERLTVEMNLYLLDLLTDRYGRSQRITDIVDSREIFIIPMLNPDGGEYDIAGGEFKSWRKNRQPAPGSGAIGTDLNRNFGFMWGCCGGSSGQPGSSQYRGPQAWSAPEVRIYRNFLASRVVGGRQQVRAAIAWHSNGEFVLWPYAYTDAALPSTMTADDRRAFQALGEGMASRNGYAAQQASAMYVYDGDQQSWGYHAHRIMFFTVELYPHDDAGVSWFYPPAADIDRETARNREAVLYFLEQADCGYRAAGLGATHCGPLNDDFETGRGWRIDPNGTDTAARGGWQRAAPQGTETEGGVKQRSDVVSGRIALVTGAAAGSGPAANDVDGGLTSAVSPPVQLRAGKPWTLSFRYTFAHGAASAADFLRVRVIAGGSASTVFAIEGGPNERNGTWKTATVDLSRFAGKSVRLLVEASDGGGDSLLEAALDDVRVYRTP